MLLVILGFAITADVTMRGTTAFFFQPQFFLIANPLSVLCFASLTFAAIRMRRKTDWHQRLHICGMAAIMGPAFGRLLPMPLLIPYAYQTASLMGLAFPLAGAIWDWRRRGRVHPAWLCGMAASLSVLPIAQIMAHSPIGDAIYARVTAGHPGADVPGLAYPPPPAIMT